MITTEKVLHKGEKRVKLMFPFDRALIALVKQLPGARWSQSMNAWHIPDNEESLAQLLQLPISNPAAVIHKPYNHRVQNNNNQPKPVAPEVLGIVTDEKAQALEKYIIWLQQARYSDNTISAYTESLKTFFRFWWRVPIEEIDNTHIVKFNHEYIIKNKFSVSYQNQVINAIKLFFKRIGQKKLETEAIQRPIRPKRLPDVLSKEEVGRILKVSNNIKHKAMLSLIYSCGLRRGELLSLTPKSVASDRGLLIIKSAKGNKDRVAPLSEKTIELLRVYYKQYKPRVWLFEGQQGGEQYSGTSLQAVFKQALQKAKIKKKATLHWLRHSYATHLLENGTDLRYIQEILGHKSSKTTEIYTHVTSKSIGKIKSPFDDLDI